MEIEKETRENEVKEENRLPPPLSLEREDVVKFNHVPDRPRS